MAGIKLEESKRFTTCLGFSETNSLIIVRFP